MDLGYIEWVGGLVREFMDEWCRWVGFGWMGGWVLLMDGWVDGPTDGWI